jgi:two-component system response regulator FlrC
MSNPAAGPASKLVLVVDDHYASEAAGHEFYDRNLFLDDYGDLGFDFSFCTAWDPDESRYSVSAVMAHLYEMPAPPSAILLDIRFGDEELLGLEILRTLSLEKPEIPVVIMTSTPREELLHECISSGSVDYLVKPIQQPILKEALNRYAGASPQYWLVGQDESFLSAVDQVARAAEGGLSSVLLLGASGAGKELFARYLHRHGSRCAGPFQAVHIPSIPEQLVEGELFGYCKGAFTGAVRDEPGRLCRADGGVLFLDEVGDLSAMAQAALLRVLESREVTRLGDGKVSRIDIQVVAATNANLANQVKSNIFRLDLYSRLGGTIVHLPSLAERKKDFGLIVRHLFRRAHLERNITRSFLNIPESVLDELALYPWDGNVRELWNYVQRVLDTARGKAPTVESFRAALPAAEFGGGHRGKPNARPEQHTAAAPRSLLRVADEVVKDSQPYLQELTFREISLLNSALEMTRDPLTGFPSRAKAVSLLKGKPRSSTNEFDRWLARLLNRLPREQARWVMDNFSDLTAGQPNAGRKEGDTEW